MIGNLFIANSTYKFDSLNSTLLTANNYKNIIENDQVVNCCTSFDDLGISIHNIKQELYDHVTESITFSSDFTVAHGNGNYLYPLIDSDKAKVEDRVYEWNTDRLLNERTTDDPVVWVAGCSISSAIGVNKQQRWGNLVSKYLKVPEVNIARGATSVTFAADQILRSDIRSGDCVIWGLTQPSRVDHVNSKGEYTSCVFINAKKSGVLDLYNPNYFDSPTQQIQYTKSVKQVVNFCKKINAELILVNFLCDSKPIVDYLEQLPNYVSCYIKPDSTSKSYFIDTGTDRQHPGPKQHQEYAKEIIKFIQGE